MIRYLIPVFFVLATTTGEATEFDNVTGYFTSPSNRYCLRIPEELVALRTPGEDAFNLKLGESGSGLIFFQGLPDSKVLLNARYGKGPLSTRQLIDHRIGVRVRAQSEGNGSGKPTAISIFPADLPNAKNGYIEGVQFTYPDKRWNVQREEVVVFYVSFGKDFVYEFILFSTSERLSKDMKTFESILHSFQDKGC